MVSKKTHNAKNLEALGAERLSELLLEISGGDAALKRRLRLELAGAAGPAEVAREVRKRLATLAKARSFVDWHRQAAFVADLDTQREAIVTKVAKGDPTEALDLMWRFMALARPCYERCDDSNGRVGDVFRTACDDLGPLATAARPDPANLADRTFDALCENDYGQFDDLIESLAPALGMTGLDRLKARLTTWSKAPLPTPREEDRQPIGWGSRGAVYADEIERSRRESTVRLGLRQIADAQGDVDAFIAQHSEKARSVPSVAAEITERLLQAGRATEAWTAIEAAQDRRHGYVPHEWKEARLKVLEALGRNDDAQAFRYQCFEQSLDAGHLRAYLKRLPDFEDIEVEERALAMVHASESFHGALAFLVGWPALDLAADLVIGRAAELDGNLYYLLSPAAEALSEKHPLAATLTLRAMIDFSLGQGRSKRYRHAARHLQACERLSERITDFGSFGSHETYLARLGAEHSRKSSFWGLLD